MAIAKRIFLFLVVNIAVVLTISLLVNVLGFNRYLDANGIDYSSLAGLCLVWGMTGSVISLLLSRVMAKWTMGVQVIDPHTHDAALSELVASVHRLARSANISTMPEVGIYDSPEVNAFATGPTRNRALVAVSTGLLQRMNAAELDGVLGHEISHVSNGDMVTMTLVQGVVNAFVMFLSRAIAFAVAQAMRGDRDERGSSVGGAYYLISFVLEIVFMILGSIIVASFSRFREYRADEGGAKLAGRDRMISALEALKRTFDTQEEVAGTAAQSAIQTLKISGRGTGLLRFFASHPPLEERIARLRGERVAA